MIFEENYLLEATFLNKDNLAAHYDSHVLKVGEKFDPKNPKFPHMSIEEYEKRAIELSEMDAGKSDDTNPKTKVVGFMLNDGRCVKFRKRCPFFITDRYCEVVIYVDDEIHGHEVITYMVGRPGKLKRVKENQYAGELPENIKEDDGLSVGEALEMLNKMN